MIACIGLFSPLFEFNIESCDKVGEQVMVGHSPENEVGRKRNITHTGKLGLKFIKELFYGLKDRIN
jgi:hypothetical protein